MDEGERALKVVPRLLELIRAGSSPKETLYWLLAVVSEQSGCESSAIRWRANGDHPYYVTRGFDESHVLRESSLHDRNAAGEILRDGEGAGYLACLCGAVIAHETDPRVPCFTAAGSFWTSNLAGLLREGVLDGTGITLRGECHREGYQSLALIPLRADRKSYGLLQLNSRSTGRLTAEQIESYERVAREVVIVAADRVREARTD